MIDGETVNVSAQEGSTVITISPETLEALSEGEHTVTIRFDDGQTEISLTIEGGESSEEPDSEDPGTAEPDPVDPGSKEPEPKEPGTKDPGSKDPGIKDPGSKDPWPKDPGYKDPGPKKPGPKDPASKDTRSVNIKPKDTVSKASNAAQNASPPTGDGSRPWLWVCLLLLSGVSLAALIITGRKRRAGS